MPRYIDADARKAELKEKEEFGEIGYREYTLMEYALDFAPTADAVEVVRCRDCEYWDPGSPLATVIPTPCRCRLRREDFGMTAEDFCSYGRRKPDER